MMFQNLGEKIRFIREKRGISLNDFAKHLGVSSGYLSQLETGKSDSIKLELLDKLQDELFLFPNEPIGSDEASVHFQRLKHLYEQLAATNPPAAEYLLKTFEGGIDYFLK